jgi:hypothetical protein
MSKEALYYDQAEGLYARGHTLETIAGIIPVAISTLSRWKAKGDWEAKRRLHMASAGNVADLLQDVVLDKIAQIQMERGLNSGDFDALAKATAAIERMRRNTYDFRAAAVEVMERFTAWVRREVEDDGELETLGKLIQGWFKYLE